jgi:hypothetical protein
MRKILFILIGIGIAMALHAQGIYNDGAYIVSQSGTSWVVDNGNFTLTSESATNLATMANLTIDANATLTLTDKSYLTVNGTLTNSKGTNGLVIQSTANGTSSLIHGTADVNATINRYITGNTNLSTTTFHLVSVPLTPATNSTQNLFLYAYLYDFDVAGDAWHGLDISTVNAMDETRGYMVYTPEATHTYQFAGPMNAGTFNPLVSLAGNGNNLVPNPYPSAIDWGASSGWNKTGIANSVYIWPAGSNNYAAYVAGGATNGGSNIIPAGQAFFVKATASPTFSMNDQVRVHDATNTFYKSSQSNVDLLRIKAVSGEMADEAVIRFADVATADADPDYDAWKLYGADGAPQLYTLAADKQMLAINSLPYLSTAYTVPLNFEEKTTGSVSFTFSNIESFDAGISIHLQDMKTGQITDLRKQNSYAFNHSEGTDAKRFNVIFGGTIGVGETKAETNRLWISGHTLYINTPDYSGKAAQVSVYSLTGQLVMQKLMAVGQLSTVDLSPIGSGAVIARLIVDGKVLTTKGVLVR